MEEQLVASMSPPPDVCLALKTPVEPVDGSAGMNGKEGQVEVQIRPGPAIPPTPARPDGAPTPVLDAPLVSAWAAAPGSSLGSSPHPKRARSHRKRLLADERLRCR